MKKISGNDYRQLVGICIAGSGQGTEAMEGTAPTKPRSMSPVGPSKEGDTMENKAESRRIYDDFRPFYLLEYRLDSESAISDKSDPKGTYTGGG